jgi:hypothetical protein
MSEKRFKGFIYLMAMFLMMMLFGTAFTKGTYIQKKSNRNRQTTVFVGKDTRAPIKFKTMKPIHKTEAPIMKRSY